MTRKHQLVRDRTTFEHNVSSISDSLQGILNNDNKKIAIRHPFVYFLLKLFPILIALASLIVSMVAFNESKSSSHIAQNEWQSSGPKFSYIATRQRIPLDIWQVDKKGQHLNELKFPDNDNFRLFISNTGRLSSTILSLEAVNKVDNKISISTCHNQSTTINPGQTSWMIAAFGDLNHKFVIKSLKAITADGKTIPVTQTKPKNKEYAQIVQNYADNLPKPNRTVTCDIYYVGPHKE